jgi:microcystin-dependent protein
VAISSLTTGNAPIIIGSSSSTTQTATHNAKSTFTQIPKCAISSSGDADDLINYATLDARIAFYQPSFNPVGTIITFAGTSAPTGYLLCDGTLYSQFTYPSLFSVIFNTYGGSFPNFRVPNTQGIFISSSGSQTLNSVSYSRTIGTRQNDTVEDHKHTYSDMMWWDTDTGGGSGQTIYVAGADFQTPGGDTVGSNGDGNFSNRLTKATWPSTAVNPGTPIQQWNTPTNVSAITGTETFPANIAFGHYIKF